MENKIDLLAKALVQAQSEFSTVPKDSENPFFKSKYADLATVVKTAGPVLAKHGLAVSQFVSCGYQNDGTVFTTLRTYLIHESGQTIQDEMPLLLTKQDAQGQGSAITYARRYSYMAVLGLVADEDDDGNAASGPSPKTAQSAPTASTGNPVSAKQGDWIKTLLAEKFHTKDNALDYLVTLIGSAWPQNSAEASIVIEALKTLSDIEKPTSVTAPKLTNKPLTLDDEPDRNEPPF